MLALRSVELTPKREDFHNSFWTHGTGESHKGNSYGLQFVQINAEWTALFLGLAEDMAGIHGR